MSQPSAAAVADSSAGQGVEVWKAPSTTDLLPRAFQDAIFVRGDQQRYSRMEAAVLKDPMHFARLLRAVEPLVQVSSSRVGANAGEGTFVKPGHSVAANTFLPPHVTVKINDAATLPPPRVSFVSRSLPNGRRLIGKVLFDWKGTMQDMEAYKRASRSRANVSSLWTQDDSIYLSRTVRPVAAGEELLRSYGAAYWYYRTLKMFLFATKRMSDFDPSLQFETPEEDVQAHRFMILVCWLMVWVSLHSPNPDDPQVDRWHEIYCLWISELGVNATKHEVSVQRRDQFADSAKQIQQQNDVNRAKFERKQRRHH
jgi:hypothetical protein